MTVKTSSAWDTNVTIKWQRNLRVCKMLKKNYREIFECARYLRNNQITEKPSNARDTNVTIKRQRNLPVREILQKKLNDRETFECARHLRNNQMTEKPSSARDINETIKRQGKLKMLEILTKQSNDIWLCRFVYYFNCLLVLGFWHCYSTFFGTCASTQVIGKSSRSPRLPLQIPWFVEVTFCLLAHNGKLVFLLIEQQAAVDTCTSTDKFLSKRAKRVKLVS